MVFLIICIEIQSPHSIAGTWFKAAKYHDQAIDAFRKAADAHSNAHAYPLPYV